MNYNPSHMITQASANNRLHKYYNSCIDNFPDDYWSQHGPVCSSTIPTPPHFLIPHTIKIPIGKADFQTIHSLISQTLAKTESLKVIYDPCCWRWHTEYSSPHVGDKLDGEDRYTFENQKRCIDEVAVMAQVLTHMGAKISYFLEKNIKTQEDLFRQINVWSECARMAAVRFPHNAINWDEFWEYYTVPPPVNIGGPRLWGQNQIHYFQDETTTFIEIVPMKFANRDSHIYLYQIIREALVDSNLCWESRKSYISLLEGVDWSVKGPIADYLLDEYICRDVSTYLN